MTRIVVYLAIAFCAGTVAAMLLVRRATDTATVQYVEDEDGVPACDPYLEHVLALGYDRDADDEPER